MGREEEGKGGEERGGVEGRERGKGGAGRGGKGKERGKEGGLLISGQRGLNCSLNPPLDIQEQLQRRLAEELPPADSSSP